MCRKVQLGLYDIVHYQQQSTHLFMEGKEKNKIVKINFCSKENIKWHYV